MADITDLLPNARRKELVAKFDTAVMDTVLAASLPIASPNSQEYIDAIAKAFTTNLPGDLTAGLRTRLSQKDRERVLIALLASRGERLNLAIHIYYAIGVDIALDEILHILLLAGVYTGLPTFASALNVAADTFKLLHDLYGNQLDPRLVVTELKKGFELPPPN